MIVFHLIPHDCFEADALERQDHVVEENREVVRRGHGPGLWALGEGRGACRHTETGVLKKCDEARGRH